jgi:hypothetical protein
MDPVHRGPNRENPAARRGFLFMRAILPIFQQANTLMHHLLELSQFDEFYLILSNPFLILSNAFLAVSMEDVYRANHVPRFRIANLEFPKPELMLLPFALKLDGPLPKIVHKAIDDLLPLFYVRYASRHAFHCHII